MTLAGRYRRAVVWAATAAAVVALDQWAKSWAMGNVPRAPAREHVFGPVYLALTFNSGAAFSLGSGSSLVIETLAVALVMVVLWFSGRLTRRGGALPVIVGFGLVTGGALSNLGDRFFRHLHGAVVDFIQLVSWWPVFNVADASITVGAVVVAGSVVFAPRASRRAQHPGDPSGAGPPPGPAAPTPTAELEAQGTEEGRNARP